MALSFIKKVFTFGKEKPAEEQAPEASQTKVLEAEPGPHSHEEHLPLASDPAFPEQLDIAGAAPAADAVEPSEDAEDAAILPAAYQIGDLGVIPLSLLEAEAEAEPETPAKETPTAKTPPSVSSGDQAADEAPVFDASHDEVTDIRPEEISGAAEEGQTVPPQPISLLGGETPGGVAEDAPLRDADGEDASKTQPLLPKGFATTAKTTEAEPIAPYPKLTWFQRLRAGLARTSSQLTGQISALFTKRKLDDDTLQDLEDLLIQADLGVETAMRVTDTLASERYGKDVTGEDVSRIMASEIAKVLKPVAKPLQLDLTHKPHVILVVGVNGTGKTTTIGKLAAKLSGAGLKVMVAAGDTFRAAAIEQLKIWADRTKSEFIGTKLGADAAGLAYDAFEQAKAKKCDVLIIDTAGRLQNKAELMAELEKIVRVLGKLDPDAPHTVLQTLDATTGQNALNQVEIFRNIAGVNGLIMTKLDGTARGGILVAISAKHKLPVYFIGVGEGVDDLEPFEAEDFAHAIAGLGQ
ncbi:signal recognition particle-docking FtsY protein [Rhizobium etli 8C-3]|uniref:Signal recognition particle receptor FtsY n=2 Tax=Rhizobium TaxID=379 RepID=A0A4R3RKD6_9HYPH|nr:MULTISPECIES: signal recognition particle-docking protein FtsY [Rhizobium]APO76689.1 signal recognition particle-docking FtsY protein [Rhizobium etli 8C-3]TCU23912.1 fused signal recognition particle receptor [Rhizobium azibense]TCU36180.1 fused signal recognition particle receptor [Rhizobium azibense]